MNTIETAKGTIKLPCMSPIIVPISKVRANNYNPNHVSDNNMELLLQSIIDNGFCFPVVTVYDDILDEYIIVDGFHRYAIFKDYLKADSLPIVVLEHTIEQRMEATVQFNRARGVHSVELMGDLVQALVEQGVTDEEAAKHLGMDIEEVYRLKQVTGIAELFKNQTYSNHGIWRKPTMEFNYGDAYLRFPTEGKTIRYADGSELRVHDIFNPLPCFMNNADMIFSDPPWNTGNLSTFYTKADLVNTNKRYESFYIRLFECISQIAPKTCYLEIGKQYLADFIIEMRKQYKNVTFFNSTYYHKKDCLCYVVRGSSSAPRHKYDGMDEEDIISAVTADEDCTCVGDLCMGRGLVALSAARNGKRFVGTELNHKRLSVTVERLDAIGVHTI